MSKELEALEALNKIAYIYGYDENIKIINKELKALEIIKRCPREVTELIDVYDTWEEYAEDYFVKDMRLIKNKDEFELLKEVLL